LGGGAVAELAVAVHAHGVEAAVGLEEEAVLVIRTCQKFGRRRKCDKRKHGDCEGKDASTGKRGTSKQ